MCFNLTPEEIKKYTFRLSIFTITSIAMGAKSTDASSGAIPPATAPSSLDMASIKSKTVVKAFDLPVVSDTYNSLVKFASPLSPIVEKIGSIASPAMDQVLGLRAGIEAKVPEVVSTGLNTVLAQVTRFISSSWLIFTLYRLLLQQYL